MLAEYQACQTTPTMSLLERQTRSRQCWRAPSADMEKINFDGAVFSGENKLGISIVIRDSSGLVIASCSKKLQQAYNSAEVEALAVAMAFPLQLILVLIEQWVTHWMLSQHYPRMLL